MYNKTVVLIYAAGIRIHDLVHAGRIATTPILIPTTALLFY